MGSWRHSRLIGKLLPRMVGILGQHGGGKEGVLVALKPHRVVAFANGWTPDMAFGS